MKRVARCRSLRPNKVQACLDRVQKDLFKQFRKAADALIAAANARARALEKEKKKNCNNNNQCQAPLVSASTQELADNCASFGKHGFVNGIFGASPMCTMPMQFCPMPTPTLTAAPKPDPDPPFEEEPDPAS